MITFTPAEVNGLVMMLVLAVICAVIAIITAIIEYRQQNPKVQWRAGCSRPPAWQRQTERPESD